MDDIIIIENDTSQKTKTINLIEDDRIDFDVEDCKLLLKGRQLEIAERELKLERERLELQKMKHEFNI